MFLIGLVAALMLVAPAQAHEVRPALLQLTEVEPDRFETLWRIPARGQLVLSIAPRYPETCQESGVATVSEDGARSERRGELLCAGGLSGASIEIEGLQRLRTDVLVRVDYLNGGTETLRATPEVPEVLLSGKKSLSEVARAYTVLGVEHILLGIDHLLFVLALLLLVSGWRALIGTITAFTLAHSITLSGATLGFVSAPSGLIEALIALSIVFVAAEALHKMRGQQSLTTRRPWLIAFAFGLLHGFGFAGALSEVGLPSEAIPAALLFFNVGVELGQVLFVIGLIMLARALQAIASPSLRPLRIASSYVIGSLAGFWTVERVLALWV
jgi:hypothetical protein